MSVENMFYDYNLICKMKSDIKYKIRMMTTIFTSHPEMWRVTGITEKALQKFKDNDFKYKPGLQIHRSHLFNRNEIYAEMLGMKFKNCDVWWDYYFDRDKTIFTTSSENKTGKMSKVILIDSSLKLFKSSGFIWKHGKNEIKYLKQLFEHSKIDI